VRDHAPLTAVPPEDAEPWRFGRPVLRAVDLHVGLELPPDREQVARLHGRQFGPDLERGDGGRGGDVLRQAASPFVSLAWRSVRNFVASFSPVASTSFSFGAGAADAGTAVSATTASAITAITTNAGRAAIGERVRAMAAQGTARRACARTPESSCCRILVSAYRVRPCRRPPLVSNP
jgi:hypothetical protein